MGVKRVQLPSQVVQEKLVVKLCLERLKKTPLGQLNHFFNSKKSEFYARGIHLLPEKWQEVLELEGEYFDY
ncbi:hypothetical protein KIN20_036307 [Parelaphostrongylus tenuis]|uniref:Uncharacterized protein n=1 Tax=Parelaphostrongylus tenuis TaxID=148309 RepID=A0AAD5RCD9_PARTN|nr:hypothetical protein KIN20_036307 [Parelaphostrongylus tenuis]